MSRLLPKLQHRLRTKSTPSEAPAEGHERGSSDEASPLPSSLRAALERDPLPRASLSDDARPRAGAASPAATMLPPIVAHSPITPVWMSPNPGSSPRLAQAASQALQEQTAGPGTPEITPPTPATTSAARLVRSVTSAGRKSPSQAHSRAIPPSAMSPDAGRAIRKAASVEALTAPRQADGVPAGVGLGLGYPFGSAAVEPETMERTRSSPSASGSVIRSDSAASTQRHYASATSSPTKPKRRATESAWPSAPIDLPGDVPPRARSAPRSRSGSIPAHERVSSETPSANASSQDDHVPPLPSSPSFNRLVRSTTRHSLASTEDGDESQASISLWPRQETFAVDLARARRFRPTSATLRSTRVHVDGIDIDDAVSGASSEGEYGSDLADGDSDLDESATANISHAHPDTPGRRSKRPPLSRSGSTDENGMLIPPEMTSMRLRMAKRQQDAGRSANVPPDLVLAAALARERSDSGPTQPRTAPLLARDGSGSGTGAATDGDSEDAAIRTRSFSDSAIAEHSAGAKSSLPRSVLSRELNQVSEASMSTLAGLATRSDDAPPKSSRARSGSASLLKETQTARVRSNADYVVAMIGPRGVGKSTIIERGLKKSTSTIIASDNQQNQSARPRRRSELICAVTSYRAVLVSGGRERTIEVLEVDSALMQYDDGGIRWPKYLPVIDGALICYDATVSGGLQSLTQVLAGFWTRGTAISLAVVGNKVSTDDRSNRVNSRVAADQASVYNAGLILFDGGKDDQKKQQQVFQWLVQQVDKKRGNFNGDSSSTRSPARKARTSDAASPKRHSAPGVSSFLDTAADSEDGLSPRPSEDLASAQPLQGTIRVVTRPPIETRRESDASAAPSTALSYTPSSAAETDPSSPATQTDTMSFTQSRARSELDLFFGRDEIIDKFLFASVTANDEAFVAMFLIVYRRFARPGDVLAKLIERYEYISARLEVEPLLSRYAHMRLCGTLLLWVEAHPSDFIAPLTQARLRSFIESIVLSPWVSHYTVDLLQQMSNIACARDLDAGWALPDADISREGSPLALVPSTDPDARRSLDDVSIVNHAGDTPVNMSVSSLVTADSATDGSGPPPSLASSNDRAVDSMTSVSAPSSRPRQGSDLFGSDGSFSGRKTLLGRSHTTLLDLSTMLMDADETLIARSITKQAWEIFSQIEPRDLIRFVLAPRDSKSLGPTPFRNATNPVARSIHLVNYLSNWTATMILLQPKTRQRARVYEKLIAVAAKLRKAENFDCLIGVLAGLNAQPVFRLESTFEPLDATRRKQFASLTRLMSTAKGFNAYRLALSTAGSQCIPYLGCHLQDITRICEGKKDMRDGLVHLSKFQQLARAAAVVAECPRAAPVIESNVAIERLHRDWPVLSLEGDELYTRSYSIKPKEPRGRLRKLLNQIADA